jgi:hypothetical protein
MHISLNFSREDRLDDNLLNMLAIEYLDRIGLGGQPYLVYRHFDAGHPHIHLVTTNIHPTGKNIDVYFKCLGKSFLASREIEKKYNLINPNLRQRIEQERRLRPVKYGTRETIQAVSDVVNEVLHNYCVTSLAQFNTVLAQYNVLADRGSTNSKMYINSGLLYRITEQGKRVGVPVRASRIEGKPTLKTLQERFLKNELPRQVRKERLKKILDTILDPLRVSMGGFIYALHSKGISVTLQHTDQDGLDRVTYVDNISGVVVDGKELGNRYEASTLANRFGDSRKVLNKLRISSDPETPKQKNRLTHTSAGIWDSDDYDEGQEISQRRRQGLRI